jgi:hypothetical protein
LQEQLKDSATPLQVVAETKVNICVVLSLLKKHELARDFAKEAINNLHESMEGTHDSPDLISSELDRAYYNLGVELEHLQLYAEAENAFAKSRLSRKILPEINAKASWQREERVRRSLIR